MKTAAIFLTLFLGLGITLQANTPPTALGKYCNVRFGFCVEYPDELFTKKDVSENNDGVVLTSADSDVQVRISGYFNVMGSSIQEEYATFLKMKKETYGSVKDVSVQFSGNEFEASMRIGKQKHFARMILVNGNFILLNIETNRRGADDATHTIDVIRDKLIFTYDS